MKAPVQSWCLVFVAVPSSPCKTASSLVSVCLRLKYSEDPEHQKWSTGPAVLADKMRL